MISRIKAAKFEEPKTLVNNRPWWLSGFERVSNLSRHSLEDPGLNPARGNKYEQIYMVANTPALIVVPLCKTTGLLYEPI